MREGGGRWKEQKGRRGSGTGCEGGCSTGGSGILFDCPCSTFVIFSGGFKTQ